jgi:hypothetical protein
VVDWFDPNTWKLPAELIGYWKTIVGGLVVIGGFIVSIIRWGLKPLHWLQSRTKSKVRQKSVSLIFVPNDLHCRWSEAELNDKPATFVQGRWHVTNTAESDVTIVKATLSKYETSFVHISTHHPNDEKNVFRGNYPILYNHKSEVSADFTFFPPIGRAPKPIISDVIFTDNFANEHRVRTKFTYILPSIPSPSRWSRWFRR